MRSNHNRHRYRLSGRSWESPMDALITLIAILIGLVGLDLAALAWGADSRESIGDDHAR